MDNLLFFLQSQPHLFAALCAGVGLLVGSFLNVVIFRLPKIMHAEWDKQCAELHGVPPPITAHPFNLSTPRSACMSCSRPIRAWENIPVFSYIWLRGKCAGCHAAIRLRYPLVELLTGALSLSAAFLFTDQMQALAALPIIWALIALTFIDLDTQLLPDSITLPLLWMGLLLNIWQIFIPLDQAVIGAMAGYLSLWSMYWLFKLITGKEGMGYGDFKLLAALGACLGWTVLPLIILLSSLVGAVSGIVMIILGRHQRTAPIPFGPYLAGGGLIALFWGKPLSIWLFHLST